MTDEFTPIPGFEGHYKINRVGEVFSEPRVILYSNGHDKPVRGRMLRQHRGSNGYLMVNLYRDGEQYNCLVHRLVAATFIPNHGNFPEVNHKDEDIRNNSVDNLEWCTSKYNANYGTRNQRNAKQRRMMGRPIAKFSKEGKFIESFGCLADACDSVGGDKALISRCVKHRPKSYSAYGFIWRYRDELLPVKIA